MPVRGTVIGLPVARRKEARARQLRQQMTPAEAALWQRLRNNQMDCLRFRRQQVIAGFIVDFYCHAAGVIVNVDGEVHRELEAAYAERDMILTARGFASIHITNDQALNRIEDTLATIESACRQALKTSNEIPNSHHAGTLPRPGSRADRC